MELKTLSEELMRIFGVAEIESLGGKLFETCKNNDFAKIKEVKDLWPDLETDWLQKIYQYYCADRKNKKQDYTPKCLAKLMARLSGTSDIAIDMCAGSGALTIQKWRENPDTLYICYELDKTVIPFLLFNLQIRNINAEVYQGDVLSGEIAESYRVTKGEEFGYYNIIKQPAI